MRGIQVPIYELEQHSQKSPKFSGGLTWQKSNRSYRIRNWSDLSDAIPQAMGYPTRVGAGNLSRYLPHQDPFRPFLVATSYMTGNLGTAFSEEQSAGQGNFYAEAILDLEFEKPLYFLEEDGDLTEADTEDHNGLGPRWAPEIDRYVEYEERPEGSYVSPPATSGMMAWAKPQSGLGSTQENQPFPQNYSLIVGEANIVMRWRQLPEAALPLTAIYDSIGRVNQTNFGSFDNNRLQFAPWTMLFLGGSFTRIVLPTGDFGWDVEYLFKYSGTQKQWNYYLNSRATTPGFYQVSLLSTTDGGKTTGTAVFFDPGSSAATTSATLNKLSYGLANLNKLFIIE